MPILLRDCPRDETRKEEEEEGRGQLQRWEGKTGKKA